MVETFVGAVDKFSLAINTFFFNLLLKEPKKSGMEAGPINDEKLDLLKKLRTWRLAVEVEPEVEVVLAVEIASAAEVALVLQIALVVEILIHEDYKIK